MYAIYLSKNQIFFTRGVVYSYSYSISDSNYWLFSHLMASKSWKFGIASTCTNYYGLYQNVRLNVKLLCEPSLFG